MKDLQNLHPYLPLFLSIIGLMHSELSAQIDVSFSEERGYKTEAFHLVVTSSEASAQIFYTTDRTKPSATNGTLYATPIAISQTSLIRAIAIDGANQSDVITHSFIYLNDIINGGSLGSYITNDPVYGPQLVDAFSSIPVISLVSPDITSDTGAIEVELETSSEMFWPDGSRGGFMVDCGIQTWGGSPTNPKKNFRLEFKKIYGPSKLEYDIFSPDKYDDTDYRIKPTTKFDKLLLRAGSQDGLNAEFGYEALASFIRNRVLMDAQIAMGYPSSHGRYVHLFINGAYAGQYHLMERPDASFFENYYGGEKEDYEVYKSGDIWDGPFELPESLWKNLTSHIDMTTPAGIENTNLHIDIDQTAAYLLLMAYASGQDWNEERNCVGGSNLALGEGGYKFILYDVDLSIGNGGFFHPEFSSSLTYFKSLPFESGPVPENLASSLEFKYIISDKMQCECYNEGVLTPEKMDSLFARRADQIELSLIAESARWGDFEFNGRDQHIGISEWDVNEEYTQEINRVRNDYIPFRTDELINYYKINDVAPQFKAATFSHQGGLYNQPVVLTLTNPNTNSELYYTINGNDPREIGGALSPSAILYTGPIILPDGTHRVKARIRNNLLSDNQIDKWSPMCPKMFYINQEYHNLVINEIHYNPDDSIIVDMSNNPIGLIDGTNFEFIELKNSGSNSLDLQDVSIEGGISISIEFSQLIEPDGFAVFANDTTLFKVKYGFKADGQYLGKLSNGGELLLLNSPNNSVVDSVFYDDGDGWSSEADDGEQSLALKHDSYDNAVPENWGVQPTFVTPRNENFFMDCSSTIEQFNMLDITEDKLAELYIKINGQILSGDAIIFRAGNNIDLAPTFDVANGAILQLYIGDCN